MKRYLVFFFPEYYPNGGIGDFIGDHDTYASALKAVTEYADSQGLSDDEDGDFWDHHKAHIYDTHLRDIIWQK